ncbi:hypothetical protein C2S53_017650 [Perilla frutescens var. hirtella]|uniref:CASP-like protein n=1 Tax=Perilla frutescens var. hirtella TaxID=608512 RepID=A0AAD4ITT8_PERFH|nr:hypothetical protein C2S53_017650 [Perilla frutescens var. hirtella]
MESRNENSVNGEIELGSRETEVTVANNRNMREHDVVLRFVALAFNVTATVVLGVDRENKTVPVRLVATQPPVNVQVDTKSHYVASFLYFVVANAIASGHVAMSLLLILANRKGNKGITMMITLFDLVAIVLVFSGVGAAGTIGLLGYKGNQHVGWHKVCNVFQKFCGQAIASIIISAIAGTILLLLVVLAIFSLYKKQ